MVQAGTVFSWAFLTVALLLIIFAVVAFFVYILILPKLRESLDDFITEKAETVALIYNDQRLTSDFINCAAGF